MYYLNLKNFKLSFIILANLFKSIGSKKNMRKNYLHKITIIDFGTPKSESIDDELKWICESFDLDPKKKALAFEIFLYLLNASRKGKGVKTSEIIKDVDVTQAAIVYHMNIFLRAGIASKKGRVYYLRGKSLSETIYEIELDMVRRMHAIRRIAEKIDEQLL